MNPDLPDPMQDPFSYEIVTGMYEWRLQHPDATFTENEVALDARWYRIRARMLQDLALRSRAANWQAGSITEQPTCPDCGRPLIRRGQQPRTLKTHGGQDVRLLRSYGYCPACKTGHFPLDKQLALLPGRLTPLLQDHLARLGTWMPFAQAAALLASFTQTHVSESTAQRQTEAVGLAYEAVQVAEVERIERDWPDVPEGPAKLVVSADGAMVPLIGGEWAEVKTVVVSEVGEPVVVDGKPVVPTHTPSYFSRLTDAETVQRLSLGELTRRRVETADQVAAVNDGAEWIQSFLDYHCPDAIQILDFPHAAERICQIGDVVLGEGNTATTTWRTEHLHQLKHDGPTDLVPNLRTFAADHLTDPQVLENLAYLEKRVGQIQYPSFQAQGWPISSGPVESGNKLVVEARLKGAGMH
jgi:hypothetical protein